MFKKPVSKNEEEKTRTEPRGAANGASGATPSLLNVSNLWSKPQSSTGGDGA